MTLPIKFHTGWFYGFKVHLVINHYGALINFLFTPANVADNNYEVLRQLIGGLKGQYFGAKGYLTTYLKSFMNRAYS